MVSAPAEARLKFGWARRNGDLPLRGDIIQAVPTSSVRGALRAARERGARAELRVSLLGPVRAAVDGLEVPLGTQKPRGVFAVLALNAGQIVSVDALVDALWADDPPKSAANAIQVYVGGLRRALGPASGRILTTAAGYTLEVDGEAVDVLAFERAVDGARAAGDSASWQRALRLWSGEPFADLDGLPFVSRHRPPLRELHLTAAEHRFDAELAEGKHREVLADLERLVAAEPYRERVWIQLIVALYRNGRQADALETYQRARRILDEELGIEPSSALLALERAVLTQDRALDAPGARSRLDKLPVPESEFIGRANEIRAVEDALRAQRLVTLTGPGGVGKTRLALRVARALQPDLVDGAVFVSVASANRVEHVISAIADALELAAPDGWSLKEIVIRFLKSRDLLLVLDNFEQAIDAAPFVSEILAASPAVRILVTSRERLRLRPEHVIAVGPMRLPPDRPGAANGDSEHYDSIRLFVERARAVGATPDNLRDAAAISDVCRAVDALPLGIELAAAWVRMLSPGDILVRLQDRLSALDQGSRDSPARHRTMRATIAWSYDLLAATDKNIFTAFGVFPGGATNDALAVVCGVAPDQVDRVLLRLVEMSLLPRPMGSSPPLRFRMLETIRAFALEQLASSDLSRLRRALGGYLLELIRGSESAQATMTEVAWRALWLARMRSEDDNYRTAIRSAISDSDWALAAGLARAVFNFIGDGEERQALVTTVLNMPGGRAPTAERASLLSQASFGTGDHELSRQRPAEALEIARAIGDKRAEASAHFALATVAWLQGDYTAGLAHFSEYGTVHQAAGGSLTAGFHINFGNVLRDSGALAEAERSYRAAISAARTTGGTTAVAVALGCLSEVALFQSRLAEAEQLATESRAAHESIDPDQPGAWPILVLATLAQQRGDDAQAAALCRDALPFFRRQRDQRLLSVYLDLLAGIAVTIDLPDAAVHMLATADAMRERIGTGVPPMQSRTRTRNLALARAATSPERYENAWRDGLEFTFDEACAEARAVAEAARDRRSGAISRERSRA
jgi:DNA-binding SARP family transcriptional activator/predicted ATPase